MVNSNEWSAPPYTYGVMPVTEAGAQVLAPGGRSWAVKTDTSCAEASEGAIPTPIRRTEMVKKDASKTRIEMLFLMVVTLVCRAYFRQAENVFQY